MLSRDEQIAVIATVVFTVATFALGLWSSLNNVPLGVAIGFGALGGLVHEIAQSRGQIWFFKRYDDGVYIGSIGGMILGIVAGLLVTRGFTTGPTPPDMTTLGYEVFFAGLSLKGVVEAAGGSPPTAADAVSPETLAKRLPDKPTAKLK